MTRCWALALLLLGCARAPSGQLTIYGDPHKGAHQTRTNCMAGTLLPPQVQLRDELTTVASGGVTIGQGDTVDDARGIAVAAGGYFTTPGGTAHWEKCQRDTVLVRFTPGASEPAPSNPGGAPLRIVQRQDVPWQPGKSPGMKTALQYGDTARGPYVMLIQFPAGQINPPHYHSADEAVSVLAGTLLFGEGRSMDDARVKAVHAGDYFVVPHHTPHWAKVPEGGVTMTRLGNGPLDLFPLEPMP